MIKRRFQIRYIKKYLRKLNQLAEMNNIFNKFTGCRNL